MIQKRMEYLYKILQVDPKADPDVIRAAFRVLAQKNHPDLNHTSIASEAMMRLNWAYETLRDPRLRSLYDGQRVTGVGQSTGVHHDPDFADWAASQAQAAHPAGKRNSNEPSRIFEVRTLSQSRAGKGGLWVGIAAGLVVLLVLLSGVNQSSGDLPYQVVTKVWVALMVFLILWGLIWSFGDLFDLVYPADPGQKPPTIRRTSSAQLLAWLGPQPRLRPETGAVSALRLGLSAGAPGHFGELVTNL